MNVDYKAYEGYEVQGVAETVLSRGNVVLENGEHKRNKGAGNLLNEVNA